MRPTHVAAGARDADRGIPDETTIYVAASITGQALTSLGMLALFTSLAMFVFAGRGGLEVGLTFTSRSLVVFLPTAIVFGCGAILMVLGSLLLMLREIALNTRETRQAVQSVLTPNAEESPRSPRDSRQSEVQAV